MASQHHSRRSLAFILVFVILLFAQSALAVNKCKVCYTLMQNLEPKWEHAKATNSQPFFKLPELIDATCEELKFKSKEELEYCKHFNMRDPESAITADMINLFGVSKLMTVSQYSCFGLSRNCHQFDCVGTKLGKSHSVAKYVPAPNAEKSFKVICQCLSANPKHNWLLPDYKACSFPSISCTYNLGNIKKENKLMVKELVPVHVVQTEPKGKKKEVPCPDLYKIPEELQLELDKSGWDKLKNYEVGVLETFLTIKIKTQDQKVHSQLLQKIFCELKQVAPDLWTILHSTYQFFEKHLHKIPPSDTVPHVGAGPLHFAYPDHNLLAKGIAHWGTTIYHMLPLVTSAMALKQAIQNFIDAYRSHVAKVESLFREMCLDDGIQKKHDLPLEELFTHWHRREAKKEIAHVVRGVLTVGGAVSNFFAPGVAAAIDLISNFFFRFYTRSKFNKESIEEAKAAIEGCFDGVKIRYEDCSISDIQRMRDLISEDDHFASIFWNHLIYCKTTGSCSPFMQSQIKRFANYINFMQEYELKTSGQNLFPVSDLSYLKSFFQGSKTCASTLVGEKFFMGSDDETCPFPQPHHKLSKKEVDVPKRKASFAIIRPDF